MAVQLSRAAAGLLKSSSNIRGQFSLLLYGVALSTDLFRSFIPLGTFPVDYAVKSRAQATARNFNLTLAFRKGKNGNCNDSL